MGIKKRISIFIFVLNGIALTNAQEVLTVQDAVKIALEKNFQIKTARNELKIDELGTTPGQAGML
ncbi:MAG: TolC family protein, partial [Flavobacteriia bacterium]